MSLLTMYKDDYSDSTVISNRFIDEYMKDANDAEIKVYLYLVRMMSANLPTSVSDIADKFNHTEREVMRALKYWENCNLLSLEYNSQRALCGIRFRSPSPDEPIKTDHVPAQIVPLKIVNDETDRSASIVAIQGSDSAASAADRNLAASVAGSGSAASAAGRNSSRAESPNSMQVVDSTVDLRENKTYTREQLRKFKSEPEAVQLQFIAESYLCRPLSQTDMQSLFFIYDELGFTCEMIDYIMQYCIEKGAKDFRYIRKVAIAWHDDGIKTPAEARNLKSQKYDKYVYTILKSLGHSSTPVPSEADYPIRWYKEWGLPIEVISEACNRTVKATNSHRLEYCDKILKEWHKNGINDLSKVKNADNSFRDRTKVSERTKNSFNKFDKNNYDFDELEKLLIN